MIFVNEDNKIDEENSKNFDGYAFGNYLVCSGIYIISCI